MKFATGDIVSVIDGIDRGFGTVIGPVTVELDSDAVTWVLIQFTAYTDPIAINPTRLKHVEVRT